MTTSKKISLSAALKELLLEKPFRKITVTELAKICGVSRMTFYYYFQDVFDLLMWSIRNECEAAAVQYPVPHDWYVQLLALCNVFYENRVIAVNIKNTCDKEDIRSYLNDTIAKILSDAVKSHPKAHTVSDTDISFITIFYTYGITGVLMNWFDNELKEDPDIIITPIHTLIRNGINDDVMRFSLLI